MGSDTCVSGDKGWLFDSGEGPFWKSTVREACLVARLQNPGKGGDPSCLAHYSQTIVLEKKRARALDRMLGHSRLRPPSQQSLPLYHSVSFPVLKAAFLPRASFYLPDKKPIKRF